MFKTDEDILGLNALVERLKKRFTARWVKRPKGNLRPEAATLSTNAVAPAEDDILNLSALLSEAPHQAATTQESATAVKAMPVPTLPADSKPAKLIAGASKLFSTQRRWVRKKIDIHIKAHVQEKNVTTVIPGQGNDLSEGGLAAYLPADLQVDAKLEIELILPFGMKPLRIAARVCNRNGFRYGLEFLGLNDADRPELVRFITAQAL